MKKALGKGLNALLPSALPGEEASVVDIDILKIEPNPEQPRKTFDENAISQLAESIASVGVVQPIIVTDEGGYYKIIAGERRWRAARAAGLKTVPAIVRAFTSVQGIEVALVENLQRQDLNPIEEANGYEKLISEYGYTQDKIAKTVGKSRPAVANALRLLKLSERLRGLLSSGAISAGHARALLAVEQTDRMEEIADYIVERGLNVRQAETVVGRESAKKDDGTPDDATGGGASGPAGGPTGGLASGGAGLAADGRMGSRTYNDGAGGDAPVAPGGASSAQTGAPTAPAGDFADDMATNAEASSGHAPVDNASAGMPQSGTVPADRTADGPPPSGKPPVRGKAPALPADIDTERGNAIKRLEDELRSHFHTRVSLSDARGKTGKIVIEYYDDEDLQRLLEQFGIR